LSKNSLITALHMKNILILCSLILLSSSKCVVAQTNTTTTSEPLVWHTDLAKANEISKASKKPIFAFFTGSDWCGWCTKLHRDVFAKPEFIQWATEKVVLLELDFPRRKKLPDELVAQNQSLQQAFGIQGYPTVWLFFINDKGNNQIELAALGSLGYPQGATPGKEEVKFLGDANAILNAERK
jgi:thioredoxin-related protein